MDNPHRFVSVNMPGQYGITCTDPEDPLHGKVLVMSAATRPSDALGVQYMFCPTTIPLPDGIIREHMATNPDAGTDGLCPCEWCVIKRKKYPQ